jgi:hypothetical protein
MQNLFSEVPFLFGRNIKCPFNLKSNVNDTVEGVTVNGPVKPLPGFLPVFGMLKTAKHLEFPVY